MNNIQQFESVVNGIQFDVADPVTARLLNSNEKREFVMKSHQNQTKISSNKKGKQIGKDNEQEIG